MIKRNLKIKNGFISRSGSVNFYATGGLFYNNGEVLTVNSTASYTLTSSFNTFTSSYATGSFSGSFTGNINGTSSWALNSGVTLPSSSTTTATRGYSQLVWKSGSIMTANTSYYFPASVQDRTSLLETTEVYYCKTTINLPTNIYYMTVTTTLSMPVGATLNVYLIKNGIPSGLSCSIYASSPAGVYTGSKNITYNALDTLSYNASYTASSGTYTGLGFVTYFGTLIQ
jgi:hypothetical protein